MKNFFPSLLTFFSAAFFAFNANAQIESGDTNDASHMLSISIPKVALLDIEGSSTFTLTPSAPTEAGNPLNFTAATNNNFWLNYSSIVAVNTTRTVSAKITSGTIPAGVDIKVVATAAATGDGVPGIAIENGIVLDATDKTIINGIGSSFTGDEANSGHQLTYSLSLKDGQYGSLVVVENTPITVTYTLSDN